MSGGGHRSMGKEGFDHLVYVRVFEGCNLACRHCFIPANPKKMSLEDIARVPDLMRKHAAPGQTLLLQWHGGEPTLFGANWLEDAISAVENAGPEFVWRHGIQTNLMTYDKSWASLYARRFDGQVGVSWDPQIRLLKGGHPESNAAFEKRFWEQVEHLLDDGLSPYLVVTATKTLFQHFSSPFAFFDFLVAKGISKGHLERVTRTGEARDNWDEIGLSNAEYARQMALWLKAYVLWREAFNGPPPLSLSPFDGLLESVGRLADGEGGGYGCWSGACDTRFHTVDASGYKRGCTAITSESDNPRRRNSLDILNIADPVKARAERRFNCASCEFRSICSSGCLATDIEDGSGECSGGFSLFKTALSLEKRRRAAISITGHDMPGALAP